MRWSPTGRVGLPDAGSGGRRVRCGGIGAVATEAAHRGKGSWPARPAQPRPHARPRLPLDPVGIDDFTTEFGYVPAWPESRWRVKLADLPATPLATGLRRIPAAPTQALVRLHNQWNAGLTGTAVRPTFLRSWTGMRKDVEAWCWGADRERPEGHVVVQAGRPGSCAPRRPAHWTRCSRRSGPLPAEGAPELRFDTLPYSSARAARLRTLNSRYEQRYAESGAAMVRVVDLPGCLTAMAPELWPGSPRPSSRATAARSPSPARRRRRRSASTAAASRVVHGRSAAGRAARSAAAGRWRGSSSGRTR